MFPVFIRDSTNPRDLLQGSQDCRIFLTAVVDSMTFDMFCLKPEKTSAFRVSVSRELLLCSMYISGGKNSLSNLVIAIAARHTETPVIYSLTYILSKTDRGENNLDFAADAPHQECHLTKEYIKIILVEIAAQQMLFKV